MSSTLTPERPDDSGKGKSNPYQPPTVTEGDAPAVSQLEIDMIASAEDSRQFYKNNGWLGGSCGRIAKRPDSKGSKGEESKPAKRRPVVLLNEDWKLDLNRREERYLGGLQPPCQ
jgi:hypothetical protein